MTNFYKTFFLTFLTTALFLFAPFIPTASAQSTGCVIIKVGTPTGPSPTFPPGCQQVIPSTGIAFPPNLEPCLGVDSDISESRGGVAGEYCQLPPGVTKETKRVFYDEGGVHIYEKRIQGTKNELKWQDWGSKEMIGVIYTVAKRWKAIYPEGHVIVMDITSNYHLEHHWGVAVDIFATTDGKHCAASNGPNGRCPYGPNDLNATIQLGKLIIDTGYLNVIWYSDTNANAAIFAYAHSVDPKRYPVNGRFNTGIRPAENHWDHFHLLIDRTKTRSSLYYTNFEKSRLKNCPNLSGVLRKICYP
jgi:hypothetical protein